MPNFLIFSLVRVGMLIILEIGISQGNTTVYWMLGYLSWWWLRCLKNHFRNQFLVLGNCPIYWIFGHWIAPNILNILVIYPLVLAGVLKIILEVNQISGKQLLWWIMIGIYDFENLWKVRILGQNWSGFGQESQDFRHPLMSGQPEKTPFRKRPVLPHFGPILGTLEWEVTL